MDGPLKLNKAGRYALSALLALAWKFNKNDSYHSLQEVAKEQGIPKHFLAKIIQMLAKAGLVSSQRGITGGIKLSHSPDQITLLEILESSEGSYTRNYCIYYPSRRCSGIECPLFCPLRAEEERVRERLNKISLAKLANSLKNHPERKFTPLEIS